MVDMMAEALSLTLSEKEKDRESKKEADSKRCVFVNFTFILSGEWVLTVLPRQHLKPRAR